LDFPPFRDLKQFLRERLLSFALKTVSDIPMSFILERDVKSPNYVDLLGTTVYYQHTIPK
jgi:hypothetical protein